MHCPDTSYDPDRRSARLSVARLVADVPRSASLMEGDRLLSLAVEVAAERSLQGVLHTIVQGLASHPGVALARIWLQSPGDICDSCFLRAAFGDRTQLFHLVASAGPPRSSPEED